MDKDTLSEFEIFSDVSRDTLSIIARDCEALEFEENHVIFKPGEVSEKLYGVLEGEVELCLIFKDKILKTEIQYEEAVQTCVEIKEKAIVVDIVGQNEVFAWSSFVKPAKTTTIARCVGNCRILAVPAGHLHSICIEDTAFGYLFMQRLSEVISRRLNNRTEKLIEAWGQAFGADKI